MERSGSQKALPVLSIIEAVTAAIAFVGGVLIVLGGGLVGASPADAGLTASEAGAVGGVAAILGAVLVASAAVSLLCGIFGVRAANDANEVMPVWAFTLIELALCVIALAWAAIDGSFGPQAPSLIFSAVFSLAMFLVANNIRGQRAPRWRRARWRPHRRAVRRCGGGVMCAAACPACTPPRTRPSGPIRSLQRVSAEAARRGAPPFVRKGARDGGAGGSAARGQMAAAQLAGAGPALAVPEAAAPALEAEPEVAEALVVEGRWDEAPLRGAVGERPNRFRLLTLRRGVSGA